MKLKKYLEREGRGSLSELSGKINAPAPDLSRWASRKRKVPVERCLAIEKATNGLVTRKDLRPDDWHLIWPELAAKDKKVAAD